MIGETEFSSLFHQGEKESMYLADVARRVILVVLFDNRTTLGMIRIKVKAVVRELTEVFGEMFARSAAAPAGTAGGGGLRGRGGGRDRPPVRRSLGRHRPCR